MKIDKEDIPVIISVHNLYDSVDYSMRDYIKCEDKIHLIYKKYIIGNAGNDISMQIIVDRVYKCMLEQYSEEELLEELL